MATAKKSAAAEPASVDDQLPTDTVDNGEGAVVQKAPDDTGSDFEPATRTFEGNEPEVAHGNKNEEPEIQVAKGRPENETWENVWGNVEPGTENPHLADDIQRKKGKPEEEIADTKHQAGPHPNETAPAYEVGDEDHDRARGRGVNGEPAGSSPPNVEQDKSRPEPPSAEPGPLLEAVMKATEQQYPHAEPPVLMGAAPPPVKKAASPASKTVATKT